LAFDVSNIDVEAIEERFNISVKYKPPTGKDSFPEDLCKIAEVAYEKCFKSLGL
jgi:hypothetical protein